MYFAVSADNRHTQGQSGGGNDPIRHIGYLITGNEVEGAGHGFVKRNNFQYGFLAANRTQQANEGVRLDASFLGQVYDFHQSDGRERDLVTIGGGLFNRVAGVGRQSSIGITDTR